MISLKRLPYVLICLLQLLWALRLTAQQATPLFKLVPAATSTITFNNNITESDSLNILTQANIYYGGGVGIGDFNNDGLQDIYFLGNMVSNKLYLNKRAMQFEDVTDAAAVTGNGRWCTGVSVVDINADGWLDIYVSASFRKDELRRTNLLYINKGANEKGIPVFEEKAATYGLNDAGYSTQGYFFDYDKDGDLDLYQVTNALYDPRTPIHFRPKLTDGSALNTDRLYRNNGNETFTNVSTAAGISIEGWGHAASISDFNNDGWPDIYVANDFVSNDLLYINNRNGTFTNRIDNYFKHTAWNAMGTDVVDFNNDGFPDLISLEMLPEDNLRKKRMFTGNEYYNYFNSAKYGYQHQYVRNVLQLSSGPTALGHPVFSDIGFMAELYQTDWSWCPLAADFDNDGFRDLVISNGLPRDVTDLDYISYDNGQSGAKNDLSLAMANTLPVVHIPNYAFKNVNGMLFKNTTAEWGLTGSSFSNGGAYADLDNDGDLDFVVNNINSVAFLYENTSANESEVANHQLSVALKGTGSNKNAIGASVRLYYGNKQQFYEHQPARGYLSTVDGRAHFGLGTVTVVDSVVVTWPDNKVQLVRNVKAGQFITITYAAEREAMQTTVSTQSLLQPAADLYNVAYQPTEKDFIDYNIQSTLPHKISQYGPGIAVGDVDKNGYDDFYIGGTSENPGLFYLQDANGNFKKDTAAVERKKTELEEEAGVLFFDADNDDDLDLYTVSGSYEIPPGHVAAQDRLYINNGKGKFKQSLNALPKEATNGSCVRAADFDKDGDLDLFVGGRVVSGAYPGAPKNFIYKNNAGKFTDVTDIVCPALQTIGMITDALWSDFDNDGKVDLVLAGEWMPVTFVKNTGSTFVVTNNTGIGKYVGWWNSLVAGDFDKDGDMDYAAGNLGLNSNYKASFTEPMTLFAKDIDKNGSLDAMIFCYMKAADGTRKPFPMHAKDDLATQMISIRKKYPTYTSYGLASMNELWTAQDKQGAIKKEATEMQSCYIENKGKGIFEVRPFPLQAQTAPVFGMQMEDVNGDGNTDLLLVGNDYGMEPYSGRHDAFNGLCLLGDGKGGFNAMTVAESGFFVKGDAKALARITTARNEDVWIVTQNQDSLLLFNKATKAMQPQKWVKLKADDASAEIIYRNGTKRKIEFYYGSTYLSQSSRTLKIENDAVKIIVTAFNGKKREVL